MTQYTTMTSAVFAAIGGFVGWLFAEFKPTFPLVVIMLIFVLYDAWTAFQLSKRVHKAYPDKAKRQEAKFTSFAFGKVVKSTIPKRLILILLAFTVDQWVWPVHNLYMAHIATGIICFEQALSILENESSCRPDADSKLWRALRRILVDKSKRHMEKLEIDLSELTDEKNDNDKLENDEL